MFSIIETTMMGNFYEKLKVATKSQASKSNIDPTEKLLRQLHFKAADLGKPLLFLCRRAGERQRSRRTAKEEKIAARHAIKLLAIILGKLKFLRRSNILKQLYPHFEHLLKSSNNLIDSEDLFGARFFKEMKTYAETESTLDRASSSRGKSAKSTKSDNPKSYHPYKKSHSGGSKDHGKYARFISNQSLIGSPVTPPADNSFGGRLRRFLSAWKNLTNDPWVLSTIGEGCRIEFHSTPIQSREEMVRKCLVTAKGLSPSPSQLCSSEVNSLVGKGAISIIEDNGFLSSIFTIPKKSGGHRPIINLKPLNKFVHAPHFKMENLDTVKFVIRRGDWCAKLNLKDAYLTVPICHDHQKYLKFLRTGVTYLFTCLAFGLSSAPWLFTKLLRVVAANLRRNGIRFVLYLDDGWLGLGYCNKASSSVELHVRQETVTIFTSVEAFSAAVLAGFDCAALTAGLADLSIFLHRAV